MPRIPRDPLPESTLALRLDPYGYVSKRCRKYGSDVFEARLMLQRTLCMSGPDAARVFYDPERFTRLFAAPGWLQKTLLGNGGVQSLDGVAHVNRKQIFMGLNDREHVAELVRLTEESWRLEIPRWASDGRGLGLRHLCGARPRAPPAASCAHRGRRSPVPPCLRPGGASLLSVLSLGDRSRAT